MASFIYNAFKYNLGRCVINFSHDTLKVALLSPSHTPNPEHAVLAEVARDEVVGAGYTAGGNVLTGVTWTSQDGAAVLTAQPPEWPNASILARFAVVYAAKTLDSIVNPLVALLDLETERGVTNGLFVVRFDSNGVVALN